LCTKSEGGDVNNKNIFHFDESANLVILSVEFRILYYEKQNGGAITRI